MVYGIPENDNPLLRLGGRIPNRGSGSIVAVSGGHRSHGGSASRACLNVARGWRVGELLLDHRNERGRNLLPKTTQAFDRYPQGIIEHAPLMLPLISEVYFFGLQERQRSKGHPRNFS